MKLLALLAMLGGVAQATFGQPSAAYDTTFHSSFYDQKVSLFRALPTMPGEIIFLGNSLTDLGEWAEMWPGVPIRNRGISSDITFGVLARLDEVTARQPAKVFLLIGINDLARGIPVEVVLANHARIIARVQQESPRTQLFVQSLLPTHPDFDEYRNHQGKAAQIRAVNAGLAQLCVGQKNVYYLDLHKAFADDEGHLDKRYTQDGLHLTGAGYRQWQQVLGQQGHCCP